MNWYNGSVTMAINKAQSEKKLFIVYVEGEDVDSNKMKETWSSEAVSSVSSEKTCVGLKITAGSVEADQFSKFYPVLCIPSAYMIDQSGVPVDIVGGYQEPEIFAQRLKKAIQLQEDSVARAASETKEAQEEHCVASGEEASGSSVQVELPNEDGPSSLEDKVEHAKKLLETKRRQKEEVERQEQIEQEKKRRMNGQGIANAKKLQMEREAKQLVKDQALEKQEAKAARERIKQKILQDKAEKAARFEAAKGKEKLLREHKRAEQAQAAELSTQNTERLTSRIQFRLPDGSVLTQEFPSQTTFLQLTQTLNKATHGEFQNAKLATVYPKKEFDSKDMDSSIKELNLVPSAVLIVIPQRPVTSATSSGGIADFIKFILAPIIGILMYLKAFVFGSNAENDNTRSPNNTSTSSTVRQKVTEKSESQNDQSTYKRHGNVYKFKQDDDDDDKDKKTWNGNSTQQM